MKNNILLNPFAIISDKKQTTIGIISLFIGMALIYIFQIQLEVFGIHLTENLLIHTAIIRQLILVATLTIILFTIGKLINKKTRIIDILNTVLIAFIPLYLCAFQNLNNYMTIQINHVLTAIQDNQLKELKPTILFAVITFFMITLIVYYIYLLFVGFKTATNAKKTWHYVLFFATFIITDLLTSYIINSF